jgi:hypothetical protein
VVRWLDRLLGRRGGYDRSQISAIAAVGQAVELEGQIEALSVVHDPISGEPAVVLDYAARTPGITQRYFGIHEGEGGISAREAVDFVLRDSTGAALIEVDRGGDVGELHRRLQSDFGIDVDATTERVGPGDRVRIRGRVRALEDRSSPHRREPWTTTVVAEEIERI